MFQDLYTSEASPGRRHELPCTLPPKNVKLARVSVPNDNCSEVKSVLSQLSGNVQLYIIFDHSQFLPCHSFT